jgi:uncharacterized protein (DUF58 family)
LSALQVSLEELLEIGRHIKGLNFTPHQKSNSILMGRHASKLRGRGMDFLELKNYVQGDDTRTIDWKATRRSGKAHVRMFQEERDRAVYIVLSQQANMFFGSQGSFKSVQAAKVASLVLHSVMKQGDRVGGVVFDDEQTNFFKASKNKQQSLAMLEQIAQVNSFLTTRQTKTLNPKMFNNALDTLRSHIKHDDLIILIGDGSGLDEQSQHKLTIMAQHNDVIGVIVYDPLEQKLPREQNLLFSWDDNYLEVDANKAEFEERYSSLYDEKVQNYKNLSLTQRIPLFEISTDKDVVLQLRSQLGVV